MIHFLLLLVSAAATDGDKPLPAVPMKSTPAQILASLRDASPLLPASDCSALDLNECNREAPVKVQDLWLRWVQLDEDPAPEAVLVVDAHQEWTYMAYVFDRGASWNLVGAFSCYRNCNADSFTRVQRLTTGSPVLLLIHRDLGGSSMALHNVQGFLLRGGRLHQALEMGVAADVSLEPPFRTRTALFVFEDRLIIHSVREEPPGAMGQSSCRVMGWNAGSLKFEDLPKERARFCDPESGRPLPGKSYWTGIPVHP